MFVYSLSHLIPPCDDLLLISALFLQNVRTLGQFFLAENIRNVCKTTNNDVSCIQYAWQPNPSATHKGSALIRLDQNFKFSNLLTNSVIVPILSALLTEGKALVILDMNSWNGTDLNYIMYVNSNPNGCDIIVINYDFLFLAYMY